MITFEYPCRLYSITNMRTHWSKKAKIAKEQRLALWAEWQRAVKVKVEPPVTIKLTRIAPREYDGDNLQSSFKSVRDSIAEQIGIDDRDKRITWVYWQQRGKPHEHRIRVEIT